MKKYLLVISHYMEEETYLYDTKKEMYKDWDVKSMKELLKKGWVVYEISNVWSDIK